ncbi:MAG: hypothetical protein OEX13_16635 [Gammaproteobacteria bacterium]|nr:hypothetical protein [Gammaproteobacteria bacterium]
MALTGACGFQMRGALSLPPDMQRTYISTQDKHSLFYRKLQEALRANDIELVESATDATAVLNILDDVTGQRVLSVSARNVPREYEVYYRVVFSLDSASGQLLAAREQTLTQDYTYDETLVLGKAREEDVLRDTIASDLVRIVLIQLSSLTGNGS